MAMNRFAVLYGDRFVSHASSCNPFRTQKSDTSSDRRTPGAPSFPLERNLRSIKEEVTSV